MAFSMRMSEEALAAYKARLARQCAVVDLPIPRESGPQYAEGVPGGELQGNLREVAQVQPAGPNQRGRASSTNAPSVKVPAGGESPSSAGRVDQSQAGRTVSRESHKLDNRVRLPGLQPSVVTLPWPPSGQHSHGHAHNQRYLLPEVIAYRDSVAWLCFDKPRVKGPFRIHLHFSPPDARERDPDNAVKAVMDALVRADLIEGDSFKYVRKSLVTVDDDRLGHVRVRVAPYVIER